MFFIFFMNDLSLFLIFSLSCFQNVICICILLWKCSALERPIQLVILSLSFSLCLQYLCFTNVMWSVKYCQDWPPHRPGRRPGRPLPSQGRAPSAAVLCAPLSPSVLSIEWPCKRKEKKACVITKSLQTQAFIKIVTTCEITSNI